MLIHRSRPVLIERNRKDYRHSSGNDQHDCIALLGWLLITPWWVYIRNKPSMGDDSTSNRVFFWWLLFCSWITPGMLGWWVILQVHYHALVELLGSPFSHVNPVNQSLLTGVKCVLRRYTTSLTTCLHESMHALPKMMEIFYWPWSMHLFFLLPSSTDIFSNPPL